MADDGQALLLTVSADTSKALKSIEALNKRLSNLGPEMERHGKRAAEGLEKGLGSVNVGKALDKIFDSSRVTILEEGSARLRIFGSALEPLGPLGIAAAAGVAALGISLEEAHKAMEYAESVQHLAEVLGTTTDKVQELNYAAAASGVNAEEAKSGIEELTTAIGAYQSNVKDKRVASVFEALGISKAQARQWQDPIDGLQAIAEGLEKVGSQSERVALAKALRFPPDLLPLLDGLVAKMKAAKANGAVIDADTVKKAADLNKDIAAVKDIISVQLKEAFIALAPEVKVVADMMASMATNANLWLQHMLNGGGLGHIDYSALTEDALKNEAHRLNVTTSNGLGRTDLQNELKLSGVRFDPHGNVIDSSVTGDLKDPLSTNGQDLQAYRNLQAQWLQLGAELNKRFKADNAPAGPGTGAKPVVPEVVKPLPKDDSVEQLDRAQATLAGAEEKLSKSYEKLTGNVDDATKDQIDALSHGRDKELATLAAERQKVLDDDAAKIKTLSQVHTKAAAAEIANIEANQKKTLAANSAAAFDVALAASNETLLAQRENEIAHMQAAAQAAQDAAAQRETEYRDQAALLSARAGLAVTAKERTDLERQALVEQQKADSELADAKLKAAKAILEQVKTATPGNADAINHAQSAVDAAQANVDFVKSSQPLQSAQFDKDHENPIQAYARSIQDLNTEVQGDAVTAFQNLTSSLVDAELHAKSLGDVAKNVFLDLIQQVLTQSLQKDALPGLEAAGSGLLHILGLASGGHVSGPGSSTSDSIPAMLSDGEFVVNAASTSRHRALLEAINSGHPLRLAKGGLVTPSFPALDRLSAMTAPRVAPSSVYAPIYNDLRGAIVQEDLYARINQSSAMAAERGAQKGRALAVGDIQRASYMGNVNQ